MENKKWLFRFSFSIQEHAFILLITLSKINLKLEFYPIIRLINLINSVQGTIFLVAAIPLVDPEFNLLPIHFTVDPGEDFVWGKDENDIERTCGFELTEAGKLSMLQAYMDVEYITVPYGGSVIINGTGEGSKEAEAVTNGTVAAPDSLIRTTSVESSEGSSFSNNSSCGNGKDKGAAAANGKGKKENGKNIGGKDADGLKTTERRRLPKPMQNFARGLGTFRRTLSKKIRRNFCASARSSGRRSEVPERTSSRGKDMPENNALLPNTTDKEVTAAAPTVVTVTATVVDQKELHRLLCARLLHKRQALQEEMVRNYLTMAEERFQQEKELVRQQDAELKHLTERRRMETEVVECVNVGCDGKASAATSYLCRDCFERQKQEEIDLKLSSSSPHGNSPLGGQAASKVDRVDSGPSLPHYVPPGAAPPTQRQASNGEGRTAVPYDLPSYAAATGGSTKMKTYALTGGKNQSGVPFARSQDISSSSQQTTSSMTNGVVVRGGVIAAPMNNTRTVCRLTATEVPQSMFYDDPLENGNGRQLPVPARGGTMPHGTPIIVNNLHRGGGHVPALSLTERNGNLDSSDASSVLLAAPLKFGADEAAQFKKPSGAGFATSAAANMNGDRENIDVISKNGTCPVTLLNDPMKTTFGDDSHDFANGPWLTRSGGGDGISYAIHQQKCRTAGCEFYGTEATELLCSGCFKERTKLRGGGGSSAAIVATKVIRL